MRCKINTFSKNARSLHYTLSYNILHLYPSSIMIQQIKKYFHHYLLQRKVNAISAPHRAISIQEAQTILIFYNADLTEDTLLIQKLYEKLKANGKRVEVLAYLSSKQASLHIQFDYLHKKELCWYYAPPSRYIEKYALQSYDLLLNLYTTEILPLEYLSSLSYSLCRVGRYLPQKTYYCDLMISLLPEHHLSDLIIQAEHYLNQLNPLLQHGIIQRNRSSAHHAV